MPLNILHPQPKKLLDARAQRVCARKIRWIGLESAGCVDKRQCVVPWRAGKADVGARPGDWLDSLEQGNVCGHERDPVASEKGFLTTPQVGVAIQRAEVDRDAASRLRSVNDQDGASIVRKLGQRPDRLDHPRHAGDVRGAYGDATFVDRGGDRVKVDQPGVCRRDHDDPETGPVPPGRNPAEPGNRMLGVGEHHDRAMAGTGEGGRDEREQCRHRPPEYDLVGVGGAEKSADKRSRGVDHMGLVPQLGGWVGGLLEPCEEGVAAGDACE